MSVRIVISAISQLKPFKCRTPRRPPPSNSETIFACKPFTSRRNAQASRLWVKHSTTIDIHLTTLFSCFQMLCVYDICIPCGAIWCIETIIRLKRAQIYSGTMNKGMSWTGRDQAQMKKTQRKWNPDGSDNSPPRWAGRVIRQIIGDAEPASPWYVSQRANHATAGVTGQIKRW